MLQTHGTFFQRGTRSLSLSGSLNCRNSCSKRKNEGESERKLPLRTRKIRRICGETGSVQRLHELIMSTHATCWRRSSHIGCRIHWRWPPPTFLLLYYTRHSFDVGHQLNPWGASAVINHSAEPAATCSPAGSPISLSQWFAGGCMRSGGHWGPEQIDNQSHTLYWMGAQSREYTNITWHAKWNTL